jgi:phosphocarrier protein
MHSHHISLVRIFDRANAIRPYNTFNNMITKEYTILAAQGLHARPATALIRLVKSFKSAVMLQKGAKIVRLNSMLNILSIAIKGGETITIVIEGEDEQQAAEAIDLFFTEQAKEL